MNLDIHLTGWQVVGICGVCGLVILMMLAVLIAVAPRTRVHHDDEAPLDDLMDGPDRADGECPGCAAADERNEQVGDDTLALFGEHEPRTDVEGIVVGGKHFATAEEFGEWFRNRPAVREVLHDECIEDMAATGAERLDVEIFDLLHDERADS